MGLDVGSKKIGIALTDPLRVTVRPHATLKREDLARDSSRIADLIAEYEVIRLIIGRPKHLNGTESDIIQIIEPLVSALEAKVDLPIIWSDERLSSKEAEEIMNELGVKPADQRRNRDAFAAAVILRRYLEEHA